MKLNILGANKTEITTSAGVVVFFSYNTPVAAQTAEGALLKSEQKYSVTTSKHVTQWLEGREALLVSQETIDLML
jgi:hypothetical protein